MYIYTFKVDRKVYNYHTYHCFKITFVFFFQLSGSIIDHTSTSQLPITSQFIGGNIIANGHITNAQCMYHKHNFELKYN